jgi:plasmid stabilization system protein ParE
MRAIRQGVKPLTDHPDIGRPFEPQRANVREWFIQFGETGYVVLNRHESAEAAILAVRHVREAGYQATHLDPG